MNRHKVCCKIQRMFALSGLFANDNDVFQYYQKKPQLSRVSLGLTHGDGKC